MNTNCEALGKRQYCLPLTVTLIVCAPEFSRKKTILENPKYVYVIAEWPVQ